MQRTERSREETKKIVSEIIDKLEIQRQQWKHLPMPEQVHLGLQSLRDKLLDSSIRPECGITSILTRASQKAKDSETKEFFDKMQMAIGTKGVRFE